MAFFMAVQQLARAASMGASSIVCCLFILLFVKTTTADIYSGAFILYMYRPQIGWNGDVRAVNMQIKENQKCQKMEKKKKRSCFGELNQSILWWSTFIETLIYLKAVFAYELPAEIKPP